MRHVVTACPVCGPYVDGAAWGRGVAKARALDPPKVTRDVTRFHPNAR